jgi:hypothetical protein
MILYGKYNPVINAQQGEYGKFIAHGNGIFSQQSDIKPYFME